ncbi:sterol desaturase family protein [Pseudobacteriovorax antillogorgiicola]|uniref:Sterol desaturase/sphingolipid hydroxylase, fatty acid hydroxylase superfamily n=1 Tax=Pseudobacteriovorax antillogorgiicola TaxID=1513793 RepID=A0A1Y6BGZ2_9BACT|nr:sterol desaturase family protein [Pseudobacteriovorax antillogorgiicola]TCS56316.1 sterol desaturase/sphingolipid hydroxylase (fatty acid hydroxylase superfamily) [Pseudobacteriovorax antillogorgiicola]SMF07156.1 Sterol desaturase/sphingolipid hydroxylase, fatty acid hydroxylase superfamily [Pseudobacteriovorax antillogorgiicola]
MEILNVITLSIPIFFLMIGTEIAVDIYKKTKTYRVNDSISNLTAGVLQQSYGFVAAAIRAAVFAACYTYFGIFKDIFTADKWWVWIGMFFLVDFVYYWFHRASHRIALLWTGHVVHHQSEEYNLTVALRQSILQGIYSAPWIAIYGVLGIDYKVVVVSMGLNTVLQFWVHTQHIDKLPRWLEYFLNTPSHHRVHHGRNPQYIDKNYAGALIIWDRMFGTFEPEKEKVVFGITVAPKTWNPFYGQFSTLRDLTQTARQRGFKNGIRTLLHPPGWCPENDTIDLSFENREKYDPIIPKAKTVLALGIFTSATVMVSYYLFQITHLSMGVKIALIAISSIALYLVGKLLDQANRESI